MSKSGAKAVLLAAAALLAAGCQQGDQQQNGEAGNQAQGPAENGAAQGGTVAQALSQSTDHSSFVGAVKAAGLDAAMAGSQPYTVFAPNNAAFQKLGAEGQALMQPAQKGQLTAVVTNHIVPGVVTADDLTRAIERGKGKAQIATMGGGTLTATESGGAITLADGKGGQARVTPGNQPQSNGVVHTLDTVLKPS